MCQAEQGPDGSDFLGVVQGRFPVLKEVECVERRGLQRMVTTRTSDCIGQSVLAALKQSTSIRVQKRADKECVAYIALRLDISAPLEQQCNYRHVVEVRGLDKRCLAVLRMKVDTVLGVKAERPERKVGMQRRQHAV